MSPPLKTSPETDAKTGPEQAGLPYNPPPMATPSSNDQDQRLRQRILSEADRCVACGLCLPHCPTYRLYQSEVQSPRGRITMLAAQARGDIGATPGLRDSLDRCLACRACEAMCPSRVRYEKLLVLGRNLPGNAAAVRPLQRWLSRWLPVSALGGHGWLRRYCGSPLQALLRGSGVLRLLGLWRWEQLLPGRQPQKVVAASALTEQTTASRGKVVLFPDCVSRTLDGTTLNSARQLLAAVGVDVRLPDQALCCGGLPRHRGEQQTADAIMARTAGSLNEATAPDCPVLSCASGCGANLADSDYSPLAARVQDILGYLEQHWREDMPVQALPARAALHRPCSLSFAHAVADADQRLLARIPQLQLLVLPRSGCCGGAGDYPAQHAAAASALAQPLLDRLAQENISLLLTQNIGCALHLAARARERGQTLEVLHPVTLLARQLAGTVVA